MFPEYRELITKLKSNDAYFDRLFEKHNELKMSFMNISRKNHKNSKKPADAGFFCCTVLAYTTGFCR